MDGLKADDNTVSALRASLLRECQKVKARRCAANGEDAVFESQTKRTRRRNDSRGASHSGRISGSEYDTKYINSSTTTAPGSPVSPPLKLKPVEVADLVHKGNDVFLEGKSEDWRNNVELKDAHPVCNNGESLEKTRSSHDDGNLYLTVEDLRKLRRKHSNRESARRARKKKEETLLSLQGSVQRLAAGNKKLVEDLKRATIEYQNAANERIHLLKAIGKDEDRSPHPSLSGSNQARKE